MFSIYLKFNFCLRIKKWKVFCLDILQKMRNRLILRKIFLIWIVFFSIYSSLVLEVYLIHHDALPLYSTDKYCRKMHVYLLLQRGNLILQAHFHGLPAKVYFCGVHISLLRKYFFHARAGLFLRR